MAPRGKVLSVNVGLPRAFEFNGRPAKSAIWKAPVPGRIKAAGVNLAGDAQADRKAHGGPDKALYAYAVEDLRFRAQLPSAFIVDAPPGRGEGRARV